MPHFDGLRLETARLILRPPRLEDLEPWTEMMLDKEVTRFIEGAMPKPLGWRQILRTSRTVLTARALSDRGSRVVPSRYVASPSVA